MLRPPVSPERAPSGAVRVRTGTVAWVLTGATVVVQIVYPLLTESLRTEVTVASVLVFCAASVTDAARVHGLRGAAALLVVAGGGGLVVEAVGVRTGVPFGTYSYTGDLGPELLGVPAVVPLAWTMMAWPALVVGRTLVPRPVTSAGLSGEPGVRPARRRKALVPGVLGPFGNVAGGRLGRREVGRTLLDGALTRRTPVALTGGVALAAWDLFLDPQMVDAGHWTWAHPQPALPLVPDIPLTNYAGWLLVAVLMVGTLDRLLAPQVRPSGPAAALYLWTYGSSVLAHLVFFDRPGSAFVGGVVMGAVAVPFALILVSAHQRAAQSV